MKVLVLVSGLMLGCVLSTPVRGFAQDAASKQKLAAAEASIDGEKIRAHVKFLADDLLEGRGPGLRGAEIAAQYMAAQFETYGLKPAGDNGTYLQQINFVGTRTIGDKTHFSLVPDKPKGGGMSIMLHSYDLTYADDYTVSNRKLTESVDVKAPIVFVGYGVVAPEYGWNDYAGVDVKGKVVLCIVGDPPSDDPKFFGGKALTYYGRWTYKFEEAARHGAIGALIIHRTDLASYGWDVVKNSNTSEKTYLRDNKDPQLAAASWITLESASKLFSASGLVPVGCANCSILTVAKNRTYSENGKPIALKDWAESIAHVAVTPTLRIEDGVPQNEVKEVFDAVKKTGHSGPQIFQTPADKMIEAAGKKGFKAVPVPISLEAHIESKVRSFQSPNVVAMIPGANVATGKPDQAVMYTAHYDHLGFAPGKAGDNIYNGAADNATGCGMLLEMARAWTTSGLKLPHSIIFAAVTAEEQGLLGSEYLGQHPPVPAGQIALDINYDMVLPIGIPKQVNVNGAQRTDFFPVVDATAKRLGLEIVQDPRPEAGSYYRSDHFSLSRVGIPAFSVETGELYEGHDAAWGKAKFNDFEEHDYHNFSDNYRQEWDFAGNAKLDRFGMDLGWQVLNAGKTISWKAGDEFERARKASESGK
ncbi:MAG: peptidase [Acidobacteriaceae bacterium]|nr:peptidase [Acidobacteriaceae bacterium]